MDGTQGRTVRKDEPPSGDGMPLGRTRRLVRMLHEDRGAAIVEMGIVSIPFFLLMFATLEQGFLLYKHEIFQTAVSDSARLIRTGQANSSGYTQEQFRQQICARLPSFMSCGSTVSVDVRPYNSFATARPYHPVDANGNYDPTQNQYNIGASGGIVMVSAVSIQPVLFPMMNAFYSSAGTGKIMFTAQAAFRNEPY